MGGILFAAYFADVFLPAELRPEHGRMLLCKNFARNSVGEIRPYVRVLAQV